MFKRVIAEFSLLLALVFFSSLSVAADLPLCRSTIDIDGLPSSSVAVQAATPVSWNLKITGSQGYDATTYSIKWLASPEHGVISEEWTKYAGHYAEVTVTYTPNDNFVPGDTENLPFKIVHGYGDCTSGERLIRIYESVCNGPMEVLRKSWSNTPINVSWAGTWDFNLDVHTWDSASPPSYGVVRMNNLPNLGSFSYDSIEPVLPVGKRLFFSYAHNEGSSGDDTVMFRIEDRSIEDPTDREACAKVFEIPIKISQKPANFYCSGLNANATVTPEILDVGGTGTITVQGVPGSKSSGKYIYTVVGELVNGSIPSSEKSSTPPTASSQTYNYKHTGGYDGAGDTLAVEIKDEKYPECKVTKNIKIPVKNYCSGISVTVPERIDLDRATAGEILVNVSGGTGTYRFQVTSQAQNGTFVDGVNSGWITQDSYTFKYVHDGNDYLGDTVTITVEDQVYGCKYTVNVPMVVFNPCQGFGIGNNTNTQIVLDDSGRGEVTVYANQGNGSGTYIYSIVGDPSFGMITPMSSGTTSATSFTFYYQHNGGDQTDSFDVRIQDAEFGDCAGEEVIYVEFIDHCESFSANVSPSVQTIDVGGSYTFTVTASGSSNQFRYSIEQANQPINGVITSDSDSGVISSGYTFSYMHDPSKPNNGDVVVVTVEDTVYGCSTNVAVSLNMKNHCASMTYSVNNQYPNPYYVKMSHGELVNIDVTIVGGSGDYTVDIPKDYTRTVRYRDGTIGERTYTYYNGNLTETGRTVNGDTVVIHYEYDQTHLTDTYARFYITVTDNVYKVQGSETDGCTSSRLYSRYQFSGSVDNKACWDLQLADQDGSQFKFMSINGGEVYEYTAVLSGYDPSRQYTFSHYVYGISGSELIAVEPGVEPNTMKYRFTASKLFSGYNVAISYVQDAEDELCPAKYLMHYFIVRDLSATCNGSDTVESSSDPLGEVIIDNTASNTAAIANNLKFMSGCEKDQTTLGYKLEGSDDINGQGANVINIKKYQIVSDITTGSGNKYLYVNYGLADRDGYVESRLLNRAEKTLHHFSEGQHLFDLDHLRRAADWLSGLNHLSETNVAERPEATGGLSALEPGTYGTITMRQFLENIRDGKTMYGMVRVLIGLEPGTCDPDCEPDAYNGLGLEVDESTIYGFCGEETTSGLCSCAPSSRPGLSPENHFSKIKPGLELCDDLDGNPIVLPEDAKIMVKGALFWDFVDYSAVSDEGSPKSIPLSALPFFPRELYFMVDVPIIINSPYEDDYCGGIDYVECGGNKISPEYLSQIDKISHITTKYKDARSWIRSKYISGSDLEISVTDIPQPSKDYYEYITGEELNGTAFSELSPADRYHLMMPNGYEEGWADAFEHLQVTAGEWQALDFMVPTDAPLDQPLSVDMLRSDATQDVPVYLYSGGLVDMHSHVNISGLVYVPQAMEMEAETEDDIRQAVFGAIVVKDGYFIKAKGDSITLISNYANTYRSIRTANKVIQRRTFTGSGLEGIDYESGEELSSDGADTDCLFCANSENPEGGGGAGVSAKQKINQQSSNPRMWQRIVPE